MSFINVNINDIPVDLFLKYFNETNTNYEKYEVISKPAIIEYAKLYKAKIKIFGKSQNIEKTYYTLLPYQSTNEIAGITKEYFFGVDNEETDENYNSYFNIKNEYIEPMEMIDAFQLESKMYISKLNTSTTSITTSDIITTETCSFVTGSFLDSTSINSILNIRDCEKWKKNCKLVSNNVEIDILNYTDYLDKKFDLLVLDGYDTTELELTYAPLLSNITLERNKNFEDSLFKVVLDVRGSNNELKGVLIFNDILLQPETDSSGNILYKDNLGLITKSSGRESNIEKHSSAIRHSFYGILPPEYNLIFKANPGDICILEKGKDIEFSYYNEYNKTQNYSEIKEPDTNTSIGDIVLYKRLSCY